MSENLFDDLQDGAFDIVTNTMGYDATWTPSEGGDEQTARVLINNPTESKKMSIAEYDPYRWDMEYKKSDFLGLKDAVDKNNVEIVTINGADYYIRQVIAKWDGKTMVAAMEPKTVD